MEIRSVFDPAFKPYGRVVEGYPVDGLLAAWLAEAYHFAREKQRRA